MLPRQNTLRLPPSLNQELANPTRNLINPATSDKHPRNSVNDTNDQSQKSTPLFTDQQHDRFDVVLEEDARNEHRRFGDRPTLAGRCILVREDGVSSRPGLRGVCIECVSALGIQRRHHRKEVLELVIVAFTFSNGLVQRVKQTRVVRTEGELGNHMREIERYSPH